jgi:hypothetical protein
VFPILICLAATRVIPYFLAASHGRIALERNGVGEEFPAPGFGGEYSPESAGPISGETWNRIESDGRMNGEHGAACSRVV